MEAPQLKRPLDAPWLVWVPFAVGLLSLCVPTFLALANTHWLDEDGAHGPIILAIVAWLVWSKRDVLAARTSAHRGGGLTLVVCGLIVYVIGRSQEIALLEIAALIPILSGSVLALCGPPALRALWFPIAFMVFMIPLPGIFVDAVTGPLKQAVSAIAETVMRTLDYPVGRTGVLLTIGPYQLLVADACSGLHSMFSLSALGFLFIYISPPRRLMHTLIMLASIMPIAFFANVVRVLLLMAITFHFGDEAGQGFMHGATGIVLLLVALSTLFVLDSLLNWLIPMRNGAR